MFQHPCFFGFYKWTSLFIMSVSFLNTHRVAMFNVCAAVLTLLCPLSFSLAGLWKGLFVFGAGDGLRRTTQSTYLMSDCVDLCSEFSACIC